ncbi:MAG: PilZ domain-containing protein [Planctomycetes bacterium]|nr:PilZ domain-containing protein [Planctomycetota bacterium]
MTGGLELTTRQANRLLQQAIRSRCELRIVPRFFDEGDSLSCRLVSSEGAIIHVELPGSSADAIPSGLIGAFCDAWTVVAGQTAYFTTCVLDALEHPGGSHLKLALPEAMQIDNRRRFERTNATIATDVSVLVSENGPPIAGLMTDISPRGMGCSFPAGAVDDLLFVGETVRLEFEFAGNDERYSLPVSVCTKTAQPERDQLAVGFEFVKQPPNAKDVLSLQRLRNILNAIFADAIRTEGQS